MELKIAPCFSEEDEVVVSLMAIVILWNLQEAWKLVTIRRLCTL